MDIPDFEELEWLESHTLDDHHFEDDFDLEIQPPSPPSSPEPPLNPPKRPILSLPPKPSPFDLPSQNSHAAQKRLRSDLPQSTLLCVDDALDLDDNGSSGKRSRIEVGEGRDVECPDSEPAVASDDDFTIGLSGARVGSAKNNGGFENGEDWAGQVQSSPEDIVEEMEAVQEDGEETILSRYASEIDGDCVPITGLDGQRVYAKLCSLEMDGEERRRKLNVREFNGEVSSL